MPPPPPPPLPTVLAQAGEQAMRYLCTINRDVRTARPDDHARAEVQKTFHCYLEIYDQSKHDSAIRGWLQGKRYPRPAAEKGHTGARRLDR